MYLVFAGLEPTPKGGIDDCIGAALSESGAMEIISRVGHSYDWWQVVSLVVVDGHITYEIVSAY